MTFLLSIVEQGERYSDFIELLDAPRRGDCIRGLGRLCRVVEIIHSSAEATDPYYLEYALEPVLEFAAEIIAVPITSFSNLNQPVLALEGGVR